ncbi:hypothetical protein ACFLU4_02785 [Chloroflexota bacterium]
MVAGSNPAEPTSEPNFSIHLYKGTGKEQGVHLGADNSVTNEHSTLTFLTEERTSQIRDGWPYQLDPWFSDKSNVNWMIRVVGQGHE